MLEPLPPFDDDALLAARRRLRFRLALVVLLGLAYGVFFTLIVSVVAAG